MKQKDIQFRMECIIKEIADLKWWRDHFTVRRAEMRKRNAPPAIIRRYDLDLKDTIDKINACEIELWGLQEMQMSFR